MGLDIVEFVIAVEATSGIEIADADAAATPCALPPLAGVDPAGGRGDHWRALLSSGWIWRSTHSTRVSSRTCTSIRVGHVRGP